MRVSTEYNFSRQQNMFEANSKDIQMWQICSKLKTVSQNFTSNINPLQPSAAFLYPLKT